MAHIYNEYSADIKNKAAALHVLGRMISKFYILLSEKAWFSMGCTSNLYNNTCRYMCVYVVMD